MFQNSLNNNIFNEFPIYTLDGSTVEKNKVLNVKSMLESEDIIALTQNKKETEKSSTKKKIIFGSTVASSIATVGIVSLLVFQGMKGGSHTKFAKISKKLEEAISKQSDKGIKTFSGKISFYGKKTAKKIMDGLQGAANFSAIRDWFINGAFKNRFTGKLTGRIVDVTATAEGKIISKTMYGQYKKIGHSIDDFSSLIRNYLIPDISQFDDVYRAQEITIKGITRTLDEWMALLGEHVKSLTLTFNENFSLGAFKLRLKKRAEMLADIPQKLTQRIMSKDVTLSEKLSTYLTEEAASSVKERMANQIYKSKKAISNNITSMFNNMSVNLDSYTKFVKSSDANALATIDKIKDLLMQFKSCSGVEEAAQRLKVTKELASTIDDLINKTIQDGLYNPKELEQLKKYLESIRNLAMSSGQNSKGSLEEIMTILKGLHESVLPDGKKIITDSNYHQLSKISKRISSRLEKATELEAGEFVVKLAELSAGASIWDMFTIAAPIAAGGVAVAKSDSKDERVSATLTTGIPLAGTFATFVYGMLKMFSGGKNLMFGAVTGAVISKFGNYADKLYKDYRNTGSITTVVKDECTHIVSDLTPKYAKQIAEEKQLIKTEEKV